MACTMHPYPLPSINDLMDATTGYKRLSILEAFFGFNQILIEEQEHINTSFITNRVLYCYRVMPFGPKNTGTTYQKFVNMVLNVR